MIESLENEYIKSIQEIFRIAMINGDLKTAIQAKTLEGKCMGIIDKKELKNEKLNNFDMSKMSSEELKRIIENSKKLNGR